MPEDRSPLPDEQHVRDLAHLLLDLADEIAEERVFQERTATHQAQAQRELERRVLRIYCEEDGERGRQVLQALGLSGGGA